MDENAVVMDWSWGVRLRLEMSLGDEEDVWSVVECECDVGCGFGMVKA